MSQGGQSVGFYSGAEHEPFTMGSGRPGALLIHGFMGTPAEMRPLGETLARNGYTARAIRMPGFGPDVPRLGEITKQDWLDAAAAAWAELRAIHSPAVLVGFSMGGAVAMHLATEQPPDAMVLFAPFWRMEGWPARVIPIAKHFMPSIAPFEKADFRDPAVRAQFDAIAPDLDLDDPETQQFLREQVRLPLSTLDDVLRLGRQAHKLAPRVVAPTLIVQGEADATVTPAATRKLRDRLRGPVSYAEIPGDHQLVRLTGAEEHPAAAAVLAFLATPHRLSDTSPIPTAGSLAAQPL